MFEMQDYINSWKLQKDGTICRKRYNEDVPAYHKKKVGTGTVNSTGKTISSKQKNHFNLKYVDFRILINRFERLISQPE